MDKKIISTDKAPAALGPYSQAVQVGNLLFISGQIPVEAGTGNIVEGNVQDQTRQCVRNLQAICEQAGTSLTNIVKTTVFVSDLSNFNLVNEAYGEFFKETPPARACVEVSRLPKDVMVEIEAIAVVNQ